MRLCNILLGVLLLLSSSCLNRNEKKIAATRSGEKLTLKILVVENGERKVDYQQVFFVGAITKKQQDSLVSHIVDSLRPG